MGRLFIVHTKRASLKMLFFLQVLFQFLEIRKEVAYGVREGFISSACIEFSTYVATSIASFVATTVV